MNVAFEVKHKYVLISNFEFKTQSEYPSYIGPLLVGGCSLVMLSLPAADALSASCCQIALRTVRMRG